ncbi:MAG: hypothetical protein EOP10_01530 [Proteobacteria bacterium]|nr:MAG: hypothetical protein EOP10_01530 [Pseudomonadota bacterium]
MRRTLSRLLKLAISLGLLSSLAQAAPVVGPKHVFIVYPGQDTIWGSYLFVVNNDSPAPEAFSFPVMLPKETVDFQAQDSLSPQELKLGTDGGVRIDKVFQPGETLMQISFKLPASEGKATASFTAPYAYETFGVFVWQDTLDVQGPQGLDIQKGVNLSGRLFDTYSTGAGEVGKAITYTFEKVPEGRNRLWVIGGIFAAILFLAAFSLAFYTRPKLTHNEDLV